MNVNAKYGWIGLYRSITNHWLYPEGLFTKYEAWIDLLLMVNHKDNKVFNGSDTVLCNRGETITSQMKLMSRWGWSKSKLIKFLKVLKKESMIDFKSTSKKTTIKVLNYVNYQDFEAIDKIKKDHRKTIESLIKDHKKTVESLQKDTNNNDNNDNNDNKVNNEKNDNKNKKTVFNFRKELLGFGFKENLVNDWLKVRKTKKAANTETAFRSFIVEIHKSNLDYNLILEKCVVKSWAGFKNSWLTEEKSPAKKEKVNSGTLAKNKIHGIS